MAQPLKSPREKFYKMLNIELGTQDPTLPDDNYIRLLMIDETATDGAIVAMAKSQHDKVFAMSKGFVNLAPDETSKLQKALPSALKTLMDATLLKAYRDQLYDKRLNKLLSTEVVDLHQAGNTRDMACKTLELKIARFGFPKQDQAKAIKEALDRKDPWTSPAPAVAPFKTAAAAPVGGTAPVNVVPVPVFIRVPAKANLMHLLSLLGPPLVLIMAGLIHRSLPWVLGILALALLGWRYYQTKSANLLAWAGSCVAGLVFSLFTTQHDASKGEESKANDAAPAAPVISTAESIALTSPLEPPVNAPLFNNMFGPKNLHASSCAKDGSYSLSAVSDKDAVTAWRPLADDAHPWVRMEFADARAVDGIAIKSSFAPAPGKAVLEFDGSVTQAINFEVGGDWQVIAFPKAITKNIKLSIEDIPPNNSTRGSGLCEWWCYSAEETAPDKSWIGAWDTPNNPEWGTMSFVANGAWLLGRYEGGRIYAKSFNAPNQIIGTWHRAQGSGEIKIVLGPDQKSFSAVWRDNPQAPWSADDEQIKGIKKALPSN